MWTMEEMIEMGTKKPRMIEKVKRKDRKTGRPSLTITQPNP